MTVEAETLLLRLEATQRKFERQLAGANRTADRRARQIERRFQRMNRSLSRSFSNTFSNLIPAAGGAALIQEFRQLADAATRIENALKVAGLEGDALTAVYDNLYVAAQRNFVPLEALTELYSGAALAQNSLGATTQELTQFTENVAVALRVAGRSATESRGALLQLSQALGSGTVRAEEFNSIQEGARPILQAVARGLTEAGGEVARLKVLVNDGRVSSEAFFRAFQAGAPTLVAAVETAETTSSQALTVMGNALIDAVGEFDDATGATNAFADSVEELAGELHEMVAPAVSVYRFLEGVDQRMRDASQATRDFGRAIGEQLGTDGIGQALAGTRVGRFLGMETFEERDRRTAFNTRFEGADSAPDNASLRRSLRASLTGEGGATTVSLNDFDPPGGENSRQPRQNALETEIEQIRQRTMALREETEAMARLNPLLEDYSSEIDYVRARRDLLNAAERAGLEITPEINAQIDILANAYADASVATQELADSQDEARRRAEEFADTTKEAFSSFISDLREGRSATDALASALARVSDRALDVGLNALFSGGPVGGGLSSLLGGLFGGFRANGGSVSPNRVYGIGERGPELFVPNTAGRIIPNHALPGRNASQQITIYQSVVVEGTLGEDAVARAIATANAGLEQRIPGIALKTITSTNRRQPGLI